MAKPFISIIGLGTIGASMGLGLQREDVDFDIVGHDKSPEAAAIAKRQGAVQRTEWNLHRACEGAELIVLATPLNEVEELLAEIAEDLKPGALVLTLANLLEPVLASAAKHVPQHAHFVAGHPVVTGVGGSMRMRADLFDEGTFALVPGLQTEPSAVQLASDFVERVGAKPLFVDVHEHDGIVAGVEQLPQIVAAALMRMSSKAPGWREARRLAGRKFAQATDLGTGAESIFAAAQTNRANLVHRIDLLQQELAEWKAMLSQESLPVESETETVPAKEVEGSDAGKKPAKHVMLQALQSVARARESWAAQAQLQNWDEAPESTEEADAAAPGMLRQMFFGGLMGGRGGRPNNR